MTQEDLWNEYIILFPDGYRQTQFKEYYRRWSKRVNAIAHIDHKAGDKMYVDFAGKKLRYVDTETGEIREAETFVAILGASQLTYVEAVYSQQQEVFIQACENALRYFAGVTRAIVTDNLKAAVTESSRYEAKLNEMFRDFVQHYSMTALPAGPYKPTHKALVEGAVRIIYRTIYPKIKEKICSLEELNKDISAALEGHNNRPMKGRPYSRRQLYEEIERAALQPLPMTRYEAKKKKCVRVQQNNHICLAEDKHYYSVPYKYIGRRVTLLYSQSLVEVYSGYERIAVHYRNRRRFAYTTVPDHLASNHRFLTELNPELFMSRAREVGPSTHDYIIKVLEKVQHPEQSYRSCMGILSYAARAGRERLEKACERALYYQDYSYRTIKTIIEKNLDQQLLEKEEESVLMPVHNNIRGTGYFE
jgi:transposase